MWIADGWKDYELLDCGGGEKLERWGKQVLVRPDPQAIWNTPRHHAGWRKPDGRYLRSNTGGGSWEKKAGLPGQWQVRYKALTFQVKPMNFKHTGLFPEQAVNWDFAQERIRAAGRPVSVLNLFAYTGAASVACAAAGIGAEVSSVGLPPAGVVPGGVPDGLGVRPHQQLLPPPLQLLSAAAVQQLIVLPSVRNPHGRPSPAYP